MEAPEAHPLTQAPRVNQRRHPFAQRDGRRTWKYLFIAPHRVRACAERFEIERASCGGEVVSREQRRLAGRTEILELCVRHNPRARVARALEMR
jgi:hypothetical protein